MLTAILAGIGNRFVTVMILDALGVPTLRELKTRLFGLTDTAGPHRVHCGNADDGPKANNKNRIWILGCTLKCMTFPLPTGFCEPFLVDLNSHTQPKDLTLFLT